MSHNIKTTFKRTADNIFHNLVNNSARKRSILKFANKYNLIYFGTIDQHTDEYQVTRGFTVSPTHQDRHYCVGSVKNYDIKIVDRNDAVWRQDNSVSIRNWLIVAIDLHTRQDLPHIFINAHNHDPKLYESFFSIFRNMKEVVFGTFENYDSDFSSRFSVYSQPSDSIEIEKLFPNSVTRVLSAHFWPLSLEISEGVLYVYSDDKKVTLSLLETMLEDGLWLANHLDYQSEVI